MDPYKWKNQDTTKLFEAILELKTVAECEDFFRDLLTLAEIKEFANRFKIARMLDDKKRKSYIQIAKEAKTTTTTVTRVAHWLKQGMGGYKLILNRLK